MQVDVAVLEVGLGGRFDATNMVCAIAIQEKNPKKKKSLFPEWANV